MNVFVLNQMMRYSAEFLDDAHLIAQINEATQILMANYNLERYPRAKIGHFHHPVVVYCNGLEKELASYLRYLLDEYEYRFDKKHQNWFWYFGFWAMMIEGEPMTRFENLKTYIRDGFSDSIEQNRIYISTKPHVRPLRWTERDKPEWWK